VKNAKEREVLFQTYVSDLLRASVEWVTPPPRWIDLAFPPEPIPDGLGEQIVADLVERAGLEVV